MVRCMQYHHVFHNNCMKTNMNVVTGFFPYHEQNKKKCKPYIYAIFHGQSESICDKKRVVSTRLRLLFSGEFLTNV